MLILGAMADLTQPPRRILSVHSFSAAGNQVKAELETVMPPLMELSIAEIGAFMSIVYCVQSSASTRY